MNKYDKAYNVGKYGNKCNSVINRFNDLLYDVPIILKDKQYTFHKEHRDGKPEKVKDLSAEDISILETIYVAKCLTIEQLMIYQELKGIESSVTRLKCILDKLMYYQLIQRITVNINDVGIPKQRRKYYLIGEYTPGKELNIPNISMKKLFVLRKDCGSSWPRYCISMQIINQIALNQIIFNDNIKRFSIGEVKMFPDYKLVIPLAMMTENYMTVFIFATYMNAERIDTVLEKWTRYINESGIRLRLVIITRDDIQQLIVRKYVDALNCSKLEIGYSNYYDWFSDTNNQIYIKTGMKALQA